MISSGLGQKNYGVHSIDSIKILFFISIIIFNPITASSQNTSRYDSLDIAREQMNNQRLHEALIILDKLDRSYPSDKDIMILYSQALYWNNNFAGTRAYIKRNTNIYDYPDIVNLHFGKILFELYHLKDAFRLLTLYLEKDPDNAETLLMLSKIAFWQGKSVNKILKNIHSVLEKNPSNAQARELKEEIILNKAPEFSLAGRYSEDSQPLKTNSLLVNYQFYQNSWLQPSVFIHTRQYHMGEEMIMSSISNKTFIPKSNTEINIQAGVMSNSWSDNFAPTWTIGIKQKTIKDIEVSTEASKAPYLFTLASIAENVMPTVLTTSISRVTESGALGKIMVQQWRFAEDNRIHTVSSWVLFPIINHSAFSFNAGYAFTWANSEENRFELERGNILPKHAIFGEVLPGIFNPYFTPQNQRIHAALAKIGINISKKVSVGLDSNVGIYARIDNPNYVYYGSSSAIVPISNPRNPHLTPPFEEEILPEDIYKVFVNTRYFPMDLKGKVLVDINRVLSIHAEYVYTETIFFKNQEVNMGLKWKLINL